jgi:hypothetical protein
MGVREAIEKANSILPGIPAPEDEEDPRWQAILKIAHYLDDEPDEIWDFVARWGRHPQEDLRSAIATCLLEHLLELHFEAIFPRVSHIVKEDRLFADTFTRCWKLGQADLPENSTRFDALMDWARSTRICSDDESSSSTPPPPNSP